MGKCSRCRYQHHCEGDNGCGFSPITNLDREDFELDPELYNQFLGLDENEDEEANSREEHNEIYAG